MGKIKVFTDGGSRGNPGPAASAFVIYNNEEKVIKKHGEYLGRQTNNYAEYHAVLRALQWICKNPKNIKEVNFYVDSQLIAKQLGGIYKIKNSVLKMFVKKIEELEDQLNLKVTYNFVRRDKNKTADSLVNETLDKFTR